MRLYTVLARTSRLAWGVIAGHLVATILTLVIQVWGMNLQFAVRPISGLLLLLSVLSVAYYFWVGYRKMRAPSVEPAAP